MNEKLQEKVKQSGKTVYTISQQTGIAYTTLSELIRGENDINRCAAGTVQILALYLKCSMEELLNRESLITNVRGSYRGIKYHWMGGKCGKVDLHVFDHGKESVIDSDTYDQPRFYETYPDMAELLIDYYLAQKEVEALLND